MIKCLYVFVNDPEEEFLLEEHLRHKDFSFITQDAVPGTLEECESILRESFTSEGLHCYYVRDTPKVNKAE
jgi:hypothetical protein